MRLILIACFALGHHALCMSISSLANAAEDATRESAVVPVFPISRTVSGFDSRPKVISLECDWGIHSSCCVELTVINQTELVWRDVAVKSSCTCIDVELDESDGPHIRPGDSAKLRAIISRPDRPETTTQILRIAVGQQTIGVPLLIDWLAPLKVTDVNSRGGNTWQIGGQLRQGWTVDSIQCLNQDIEVSELGTTDGSFSVQLTTTNGHRRICRLRCRVRAKQQKVVQDQQLDLVLESNEPRSIPSTLSVTLTDNGRLRGETRLLFPGARDRGRPRMTNAALIHVNGRRTDLITTENEISTTAIKVAFRSQQTIHADTLGSADHIRFSFDGGGQLDCPILISYGGKK